MMDDPIEIGWRGLKDRACADPEEAKRCVMVAREDYAASFSALEARGWRLVHPEGVTKPMLSAANQSWQHTGEIEAMFTAALAGAPTYATPPAGEKP